MTLSMQATRAARLAVCLRSGVLVRGAVNYNDRERIEPGIYRQR